jgi:hypothetical protein
MALRDIFRDLIDPAARHPLPPGVSSDEMELRIGPTALTTVENLSATESFVAAERVLARFFGDERAGLALKKSTLTSLEGRMRWVVQCPASPPVHDLDPLARRGLGLNAANAEFSAGAAWRSGINLVSRILDVMASGIALCCRRPVMAVAVRRFRLAIPAILARDFYQPLVEAFRARGDLGEDSLVVINDGTTDWRVDGAPLLALAQMPVPVPRMVSRYLGPATLASFRLLAVAWRWRGQPEARQLCVEAIRLIRDSLSFYLVSSNVVPEILLDAEEASAAHILRAMVLGKAGTRVARWPHSAIDSPGALCAYFGYDLFLSSGPYQARTYSSTWWPGTRSHSVGTLRQSREMNTESSVREDICAAVEAHLEKGGKVCGCFLPSWLPVLSSLYEEPIRRAAGLIAGRPDWMLVVKPKGLKSYLGLRELLAAGPLWPDVLEQDGRIIIADYEVDGVEICATGWLIAKMACGVGVGSVQYEAIVTGTPVFGYYPWLLGSPMQQQLIKAGLLHRDADGMEAALTVWLEGKSEIQIEWFKENLDPWADGGAISRILDILVP